MKWCALALATAGLGVVQASPEWRPTAGPAGGHVVSLDVGGTLAAMTTPLGVHVSLDAGQTWSDPTRLGFGPPVSKVVSVAGDMVLVSGRGELFSTQDGQNWLPMLAPDFTGVIVKARRTTSGRLLALGAFENPRPGVLHFTDDDAETWSDMPFLDPVVAFDVRGDEVLALTLQFGFFATVHHSFDQGSTWTVIAGGPDDVGGVSSAFMSDAAFLGTSGVAIIGSSGFTWTSAVGATWQSRFFSDIAGGDIWNTTPHLVGGAAYIAAYRADAGNPQPGDAWFIWRTRDGENWTRLSTETYPADFSQFATWAADGDHVLQGSHLGLYQSLDGAETFSFSMDGVSAPYVWAMTSTESSLLANVLDGNQVWRLDSLHDEWQHGRIFDNGDFGGTVLELWSPGGDTVFAGHLMEGVTRSEDGGVTWDFARSGIAQYNGTAGQQYREIQAFAQSGNAIFAGSGEGLEFRSDGGQGFVVTGGGVFRSLNGGQTWTRTSTGLPIIGRDSFFQPQYDPVASMEAVNGVVLASHFFSGVSRSTNIGANWTRANTGLPTDADGLPAFVADFEVVGTDVFAALQWFGGDAWGVFRSSDGGLTWTPARNGLPQISLRSLAWHDGRLYAGTKPWFITRLPFVDPLEGVYVSDDQGQSWSKMSGGLDGIAIQDLEVHDGVLYAGTIGAGVWALSASCSPADMSGASDPGEPGYGIPDGVLDASDLFYFLDQFAAGDLGQADLTGSSDPLDPRYGHPDGLLDASDLFYFLDVFAAGCA